MYTLVVGQSLFSAYFAFAIGFRVETFGVWDAEFNNMRIQYIVAVASFWAALLIISFGLRKGIEALSKIIVPVFFLTVCYTIYVAFTQPGVPDQFLAFLMPDFSRIGFREVFAAMGQCFFSVGLGAIVIIGYAKFMRDDENIRSISSYTAFNDSAASVLASLFIIPTALAFGMGLHSGPDLYFNTLPRIFSIMDNGRIIGGCLAARVCPDVADVYRGRASVHCDNGRRTACCAKNQSKEVAANCRFGGDPADYGTGLLSGSPRNH